jgi:hypothetical protein
MERNEKEEKALAAQRAEVARIMSAVDWPLLVTIYADKAKRTKLHYDSLLKAGFTETQALDLCWRQM